MGIKAYEYGSVKVDIHIHGVIFEHVSQRVTQTHVRQLSLLW